MGGYDTLYGGSNYGLSPKEPTETSAFAQYNIAASTFGLTTDARTSNQLKEVSEKLNTGAKVIEVQGLTPGLFEAMPQQHLEEINRLRKLTGLDLTFHGPLIEPTGYGEKSGGKFTEIDRQQAENQIFATIARGQKMKPDGNIVVTLHASNGLPEPETKVKKEDGTFETIRLGIVDPYTGQIQAVPQLEKDYLENKGKATSIQDSLEEINKRSWTNELTEVSYYKDRSDQISNQLSAEALNSMGWKSPEEAYLGFKKDPEKFMTELKKFKSSGVEGGDQLVKSVQEMLGHFQTKETYLNNSYMKFKELYNKAMNYSQDYGSPEERKKLENFAKQNGPIFKAYGENKVGIEEFNEKLEEGMNLLGSIQPPKRFVPIRDFAIDKSAETFSNVAFRGFKEFGKGAPIISIENPPAGSGISRAEDLKLLVDKTREKFVSNAMKSKSEGGLGMSESSAKDQAEKLIGVTWDVGHINMLRGFGYSDKDLVKQTETVAKQIKHIHLSDNFGYEHTELPMGMGDVPMAGHLAALKKYGAKVGEMKKVIETGGPWFQFFGGVSPLPNVLEAFGSPIYAGSAGPGAPYWNQGRFNMGGYFSGYGMNPDVHHSLYGTGFSNLPVELGGQMSGRSRMSGNPME